MFPALPVLCCKFNDSLRQKATFINQSIQMYEKKTKFYTILA